MKPTSDSIESSVDSARGSDDRATRRHLENAENRKWRVGTRVERELDGLWFPGTIVHCHDGGEAYDVEYDEDQNCEPEVPVEELRLLDEQAIKDPNEIPRPQTALSQQQQKDLLRDSLLLQTSDYDPNKAPTVVLHHRGETHAAASAYIINGLENNIAAGNGLRGIRWLRVNTL
ncbi:hypothetical protein Poli38472_001578 [Pythium oligandrum]|uniref:Tudor domain-containing protein n=1 Tax=Pythium oligandrum TaxID=41045 RepID=A0A8K1FRW7_PYTOL|nr:hypothetical protein Poli38472_001578 [Pythium oligandrum]|eukprot:TMW69422.1 hypothetical protein Poli38472_001578 [Pythium oligandrum]